LHSECKGLAAVLWESIKIQDGKGPFNKHQHSLKPAHRDGSLAAMLGGQRLPERRTNPSNVGDARREHDRFRTARGRRSYRHGEFLLSSTVNFNTDSEEKDHGNTRQKVSREVRRKEQG
jgi:hypothetical protein